MREVELQIVQLSPALTAFARTFRLSQTDVEDLVQETVVKALGAIDSYETGTALKSWLFTIMRNTFCTMFNRQKREPVGVEPYYGEMVMQPTQEWAVRHHELEAALQRLPSERRDALVLVAYGVSYEEVAASANCEVGTVKSRVSRGRQELAELLDNTLRSKKADTSQRLVA